MSVNTVRARTEIGRTTWRTPRTEVPASILEEKRRIYPLPHVNIPYLSGLQEKQKNGLVNAEDIVFNQRFIKRIKNDCDQPVRGILVIEDDELGCQAFTTRLRSRFRDWDRWILNMGITEIGDHPAMELEADEFPLFFASTRQDYDLVPELVLANPGLIHLVISDLRLEGYPSGGRGIARQLRLGGYQGWLLFCSGSLEGKGLEEAELFVDKFFFLSEFIDDLLTVPSTQE